MLIHRNGRFMVRIGLIIAFSIIITLALADFTAAKELSIDGYAWELENIAGSADDEFTLELVSASGPVNLYILEWDEYFDWFDQETDWEIHGVTEGEWEWTMPNDEEWVLVIENPNDYDVDVEYKMTNDTVVEGILAVLGVCCIVGIIIAVLVFGVILIVVIILIVYFKKKKKQRKKEKKQAKKDKKKNKY